MANAGNERVFSRLDLTISLKWNARHNITSSLSHRPHHSLSENDVPPNPPHYQSIVGIPNSLGDGPGQLGSRPCIKNLSPDLRQVRRHTCSACHFETSNLHLPQLPPFASNGSQSCYSLRPQSPLIHHTPTHLIVSRQHLHSEPADLSTSLQQSVENTQRQSLPDHHHSHSYEKLDSNLKSSIYERAKSLEYQKVDTSSVLPSLHTRAKSTSVFEREVGKALHLWEKGCEKSRPASVREDISDPPPSFHRSITPTHSIGPAPPQTAKVSILLFDRFGQLRRFSPAKDNDMEEIELSEFPAPPANLSQDASSGTLTNIIDQYERPIQEEWDYTVPSTVDSYGDTRDLLRVTEENAGLGISMEGSPGLPRVSLKWFLYIRPQISRILTLADTPTMGVWLPPDGGECRPPSSGTSLNRPQQPCG